MSEEGNNAAEEIIKYIPQLEYDIAAILNRKHRWRWRLLSVWIILFSIVSISSYRANKQRIQDIQNSRISSCKQTYTGVKQIFEPLFTPKNKRTKKEQRVLDKFNKRITDLKKQCNSQTNLK